MKKIDQCFDEGWDGVSNNTKRRRGRPDVFSRNTEFAADDEYSKGMREGLARQWPYKPKSRSMTNLYYVLEGYHMAKEVLGETHFNKLFTKTYKTHIKEEMYHQVVLEQFGRMKLQNGFSPRECVQYIWEAGWKLLNGCTGHEVAAYIRQVRNQPPDTQGISAATDTPDTTAKKG